jgi:hypothetical protein
MQPQLPSLTALELQEEMNHLYYSHLLKILNYYYISLLEIENRILPTCTPQLYLMHKVKKKGLVCSK